MRRRRYTQWFRRNKKKWYRLGEIPKDALCMRRCESLCFAEATIYRSEFEKVLKEIATRQNVETGGELFGFYRDNGTPVVCYAIGPGPKANHRYAFFNQDMDYLLHAGRVLCERYGLEHIGEWHSHHRMGLAHPSGHDAESVANGVRSRGRRRFLLCVGNIVENRATLGGFAFTGSSGTGHNRVGWQIIDGESPYRTVVGDF